MSRTLTSYLRRHHWGIIATFIALSGTAYAAAKIDSKDIAKDAVRSKHVKNDALKGKDIKESKLGTVPSAGTAGAADFATNAGDAATVGGVAPSAFTIGRFSKTPSFCDPTGLTFVDCATVTLDLPRSGRVLLAGAGRAHSNIGNCAFDVDSNLKTDALVQFQIGGGADVGAFTYVTDPLPAGEHSFSVTCNEIVAPFQLSEARLSAVMIGDA